jgi:AhpD family alkylhydroperoxidase
MSYHYLQTARTTVHEEDDMPKYPGRYTSISKRYKGVIKALEGLGKATKSAGPLSKKTSELIQLAAAAAIRAEGSVHSHTRRALEAGAKPAEVQHAIILLTSTIGFPTVSAALSWVDDVLARQGRK